MNEKNTQTTCCGFCFWWFATHLFCKKISKGKLLGIDIDISLNIQNPPNTLWDSVWNPPRPSQEMFGGSKHRSSIGTTGCSYGFGVRHQPLPRFQGSKPGWKRLLGKELRKLQLPPPRARRARSPNLASSGKNLRVFWPLMLGKFPHTHIDWHGCLKTKNFYGLPDPGWQLQLMDYETYIFE